MQLQSLFAGFSVTVNTPLVQFVQKTIWAKICTLLKPLKITCTLESKNATQNSIKKFQQLHKFNQFCNKQRDLWECKFLHYKLDALSLFYKFQESDSISFEFWMFRFEVKIFAKVPWYRKIVQIFAQLIFYTRKQ